MRARACGYARVSTDEEIQLNALANQIDELKTTIEKKDWEMTELYIDEGKSGTTTKKRNEYNRLCVDMETDKWDIIVVKSQDRLMRSAKDWYIFLEKLTRNEKQLYFYIENKFYAPDDSLITGIKAILAEDYSRDLSKKEKKAHSTRQQNLKSQGTQNGRSLVLTGRTWGYDKINKEVVVNETEAKMVSLIYQMAAYENVGSRIIANRLYEKGYRNRNGGKIADGVIRNIIRNPLYKGTAVLNKQSFDFETKQTKRSEPQNIIYVENAVEAIVTEELWKKANENIDKRSILQKSDVINRKRIGQKIGMNPLSGKIFCGYCNESYWIRTRRTRTSGNIIEWSCQNYVKNGRNETDGCQNNHIKQEMVEKVLREFSMYLNPKEHESEFEYVFKSIEKLIMRDESTENLKQLYEKKKVIEERKNTLLERYLDNIIDDKTYTSAVERFITQIEGLEEQIFAIQSAQMEQKQKIDRIRKIKSRLTKMQESREISLIDILEYIEKIIVYKEYMEIQTVLGTNYRVEYSIIKSDCKRNIGGVRPTELQINSICM